MTTQVQEATPAVAKREVEKVELNSVYLWEGKAPKATGEKAEDRPSLAFLPAPREKANGCAVIVCPGGGYWIRAADHEGLQVAQWLNAHGIHAFLLSYRIRTHGYEREVALLDGTRAVRYVRAHAAEYGVDPKRIGMIGFSAGCHLIGWVAEKADAGVPDVADPVERVSSRPDFLMMVYGGASVQSGDPEAAVRPVRADMPPAFMVLTHTDFVAPESCMRQMLALRRAGIEGEMHIFGGDGSHGRGMHTGDPETGVWPGLAVNWMRRNNFMTALPRVAVEGKVTIDGAAPYLFWITFVPVDDPNAPAASVHVSDADPKNPRNGHYAIQPKYGPVPGRYRVEIRHQARDITSNPTMQAERLYTKASPADREPMVVEIKAGENKFDFAVRTK